MNEIQRAKIVLKILNKIYPKIKVPLQSRNVFTLLISVLLSAQCTDINVNNVTKNIYPKYYKPEHFIRLGRKKIGINFISKLFTMVGNIAKQEVVMELLVKFALLVILKEKNL